MLTVITFIIVLGILVLFHEFGHYIAARIFKVKAEEFGFGYPPRIFGFVKDDNGQWKKVGRKEDAGKYKNTVWSLNWFPIGGFVKIKGEDENQLVEPDSLGSKKIWQKIVILFAGVFMNVVLCVLIFAIGFNFGMPSAINEQVISQAKSITHQQVQVVVVQENSPAQSAGIQIGDVLNKVDEQKIKSIDVLQSYINQQANQEVNLTISRLDKQINLQVTPQVSKELDNRAVIGVGLAETGLVSYPWYQSIWKAILTTYQLLIAMLTILFEIIKSLFTADRIPTQIGGPVAIAQITGQYARMGIIYLMQFTALLSLNLAILNILPIPALDGGRILFFIVEKFRGKPIRQHTEAAIHNIGFLLLMLLVLYITVKDVLRLF